MIAGLALASVYVFATLRGEHGIPALLEKRSEVRRLQEQNAHIQSENARLREGNTRLKTSQDRQEEEIRNQLRKQREGETTIILDDAPKTSGEPALPAH